MNTFVSLSNDIELEEDDLITESFALDSLTSLRNKLLNHLSDKYGISQISNNAFKVFPRNGKDEYVSVSLRDKSYIGAVLKTTKDMHLVSRRDNIDTAYAKICHAIDKVFGNNFKIISESYSRFEAVSNSGSTLSRWETKPSTIMEAVDTTERFPVYFVFVSEHKPVLSDQIRRVTVSDWTHAGMAFDASLDKIYTFAMKKGKNKTHGDNGVGFIAESLKDYQDRPTNDVMSVVVGFVDKEHLDKMKEAIGDFQLHSDQTIFSWGMIADFLFRHDKGRTKHYKNKYLQVCSSFCDYVMNAADLKVTPDGDLVSPESLKEGLFTKENAVRELFNDHCNNYSITKVREATEKFANEEKTRAFDESYMFTEAMEEEDFDTYGLDDIEPVDDSNVPEDNDTEDYSDSNVEDTSSPETTTEDTFVIGIDTSNEQNEYDPKELETVNKLIASETAALSEYFVAAKETKLPILSKVYTDIGDEERFHVEQLLYAKSQITGEPYEPRDLDVKREYEELLSIGMDSEDAMTTAIDRRRISDDNPIDAERESAEEVEESIAALESACMSFDMFAIIMESKSTVDVNRCMTVITEAYFMEAITTNDSNARVKTPIDNPFVLVAKIFKSIVRTLRTLTGKFRKWQENGFHNAQLKRDWIKRHGIKGLFEEGIELYFYDDSKPDLSMVQVFYQLIDRIDSALELVCRQFGIKTNGRIQLNGIQRVNYNTLQQAINGIKNIQLTKTKVIVNDNTKDALENLFFGETPNKITNQTGDPVSANTYNSFSSCLDFANTFMENKVNAIMEFIEQMSNNMNSIYHKKPEAYKSLCEYMKIIQTVTQRVISAVASDLGEYVKVNNKCTKEATAEADHNAAQSSK